MRTGGLSAPLSLLPVDLANGLEFDAVVVVEPAAIAEETARGLRALYVALTRPTRRLAVVHPAPLPAALDAALGDARPRWPDEVSRTSEPARAGTVAGGIGRVRTLRRRSARTGPSDRPIRSGRRISARPL